MTSKGRTVVMILYRLEHWWDFIRLPILVGVAVSCNVRLLSVCGTIREAIVAPVREAISPPVGEKLSASLLVIQPKWQWRGKTHTS
jgi:hypothetical protein